MKHLLLLFSLFWGFNSLSPSADYSIYAIRYADSPGDSLADLMVGGPKDQKLDTIYAMWLIRGGGHNILSVKKLAGVQPEQITDIVVSHAHWDHMGGIDLFPNAIIWIQKEEFRYYTGEAWQAGGDHGGIDPEDVQALVRLNTEGRVRLIDGDNVEIFPGIRAYTGGRHTYASPYLLVEGTPRFVLASDNTYLYRNLETHIASATFSDADHAANIKNQERMIQLAGSIDRVIPGHDALQFQKFPTQGRLATLKAPQ
jgi:glyoxylase-like metal-dependent hydrolase (beta-lactamase superfamily II)